MPFFKLKRSNSKQTPLPVQASVPVAVEKPPAYDAIGVPPSLLRRTPASVLAHIVALAGVRTCVILRHLPAMERLVYHHIFVAGRSRRKETAAMQLCLEYRWSAGVQLLVDSGFQHALLHRPVRNYLKHITLTPMAIRVLWHQREDMPSDAFASLVLNAYQQASDSKNPADNIVRWCCERSRPFLIPLGEELVRRGTTIADLRKLCQRAGVYYDDRDLVWRFIHLAARYGTLDLVCAMDAICAGAIEAQEEPFICAAASGNLDVLRYVCAKSHRKNFDKAITAAVANTREYAFNLLSRLRPQDKVHADLAEATRCTQLDLFERLWDISPIDKDKTKQQQLLLTLISAAAKHNSVDILTWLLAKNRSGGKQTFTWTVSDTLGMPTFRCLVGAVPDDQKMTLFNYAAERDQWAQVQWAAQTYPQLCQVSLVTTAIGHGYTEEAKRLCVQLKMNLASIERLHCAAIVRMLSKTGRVEALKELCRRMRFQPAQENLEDAFTDCNVALAAWVYEHNPNVHVTDAMLTTMLDHGDYAMSQWAMSIRDNVFNERLLDAYNLQLARLYHARLAAISLRSVTAAQEYDLCLYRHRYRATVDKPGAIDEAAQRGFLDVVIWLRDDTGADFSSHTMDQAARNGHLHVVEWMHNNRATGCSVNAMTDALDFAYFDVAQFLQDRRTEGCSKLAMDLAIENGAINTVRWLCENRTEQWSEHLMKTAALQGHLAVVQFLHESGYERCSDNDIKNAPQYIKNWFKSLWAK
ncbi:hypothetical protein RI367_006278 [Sorochytrium milnesiophthora]